MSALKHSHCLPRVIPTELLRLTLLLRALSLQIVTDGQGAGLGEQSLKAVCELEQLQVRTMLRLLLLMLLLLLLVLTFSPRLQELDLSANPQLTTEMMLSLCAMPVSTVYCHVLRPQRSSD